MNYAFLLYLYLFIGLIYSTTILYRTPFYYRNPLSFICHIFLWWLDILAHLILRLTRNSNHRL